MRENYMLYSANILGTYKDDEGATVALFADGTLVDYTAGGDPNRYTVIDVSSDDLPDALEWLKDDSVSLDGFDYIDTFQD